MLKALRLHPVQAVTIYGLLNNIYYFPTKNISNEAKLFPDPGTNEYPSWGKKNIFHGPGSNHQCKRGRM